MAKVFCLAAFTKAALQFGTRIDKLKANNYELVKPCLNGLIANKI